jgi:hypothetical protein
MTWVKLDDGFFDNSKAIDAGKDGRALYLAGLCHCAASLTDGFISTAAASLLCVKAGAKRSAIAKLIEVGMWIEEEGGYAVPDYLEYNPTSAKVQAEREAARERMRQVRQLRKGRSGNVQPNVRPNFEESSPNPSRPVPSPSVDTYLDSLSVGVEPTRDARAVAAVGILADEDVASANTVVNDPPSYRQTCLKNRVKNDLDDLDRIASRRPDLDPVALIRELLRERYMGGIVA